MIEAITRRHLKYSAILLSALALGGSTSFVLTDLGSTAEQRSEACVNNYSQLPNTIKLGSTVLGFHEVAVHTPPQEDEACVGVKFDEESNAALYQGGKLIGQANVIDLGNYDKEHFGDITTSTPLECGVSDTLVFNTTATDPSGYSSNTVQPQFVTLKCHTS